MFTFFCSIKYLNRSTTFLQNYLSKVDLVREKEESMFQPYKVLKITIDASLKIVFYIRLKQNFLMSTKRLFKY